jgi:hypothetical protein
MNSKKGFRKAKGNLLRTAAGVAVLIVTAISTAALLAIPARGSGSPSASSSQLATAGASVSLADLALTFAGVLVALTVVVLTVDYGRRRIARRRAGGRRGGTHAKASAPRRDSAMRSAAVPSPLHPDHPSWPGRDPRWAATEPLPVRVRGALRSPYGPHPDTDLAPQLGAMPLRGAELTLPSSGRQEDQGLTRPGRTNASVARKEPVPIPRTALDAKNL